MHNTNKILLFIFLGVLVITMTLVSSYLYTQYGGAKNNKVNVNQGTLTPNTPSQNDASLIYKSAPLVYTDLLPPATVGKPYKAAVRAAVFNLNVQINGKVVSGLPPNLKLTSCSTEYNSPTIAKIAAKNSFGECKIEGIPQQSGNFTVKVYFYINDEAGHFGYFNRNIPLIVNP